MTPIITNARDLLAHYPVLFCDVWGVLHDGVREYAAAGDALERYRRGGGIVILVSNAPYPAASVAKVLDDKQVRRTAWDAIVCSGDIARDHIAGAGYRLLHHIGPPRGLSLFEGLDARLCDLDGADAIVCTGLDDDSGETAASYRQRLREASDRAIPFVCANPDRVVDVGGRIYPCAGAVAAVYEEIGGAVYWAGKPYAPAYRRALDRASVCAGRAVAPADVLAIGDSVTTDLAGAAAAGIDALFIAGGIHRGAAMPGGAIDAAALERLIAGRGVKAAAPALAW